MDQRPLSILDLPVEVMTDILDFLTYSDLKDACLVCTKWYKASLMARRAKRECLYVRGCVDVSLLLGCERSFENIYIKNKFTIWSAEDFWFRFGPYVQSLTISSCSIAEGNLFKVLSLCPKLTNLILEYCVTIKRSRPAVLSDFKLTHLKNITLNKSKCFDSALCDFIVERAPNLKSIIVYASPIIQRLMYLSTSCYMLPIAAYMENRPDIQFDLRLEFEDPDRLEKRLFKKIVWGFNVRVTSLITSNMFALRQLNGRGSLKELSLNCNGLGSIQFWEICNSHPSLEKLFLSRCDKMRDSVGNLCFLRNLTHLELSFQDSESKFSDEQILVGLCSTVNTTLKSLYITACGQSEDIIVELARTHPTLTALMLSYSPNVTDRSIQAVFQHQVLLEFLKVRRCDNVSDDGLRGKLLPNDSLQPYRINPTGHSIFRLKSLKQLSFVRCPKISDQIFENGLAFPEIREVELYCCEKITESALRGLIIYNPMLEVVQFALKHKTWSVDSLIPLVLSKLWRLKKLRTDGHISKWHKKLVNDHCKKANSSHHDVDSDGEESVNSGDPSDDNLSEDSDNDRCGNRRKSQDKNEETQQESQNIVNDVQENTKEKTEHMNPERRENLQREENSVEIEENVAESQEGLKRDGENPHDEDEDKHDASVSDDPSENSGIHFVNIFSEIFRSAVRSSVFEFLGGEGYSDDSDEDSEDSMFGPMLFYGYESSDDSSDDNSEGSSDDDQGDPDDEDGTADDDSPPPLD